MGDPVTNVWKPSKLVRWMRKHGWSYTESGDDIRRRLYDLASTRSPWWDWGHRLMILTGSDFCGSWAEPEPPTWWYRRGAAKRMVRTGYPRHPFSTFEIVTDYAEFRRRTEGLDEDGMYAWQAIGLDQDHQLMLGHRYWGGNFYGMSEDETVILRRYLRMWRRLDWFGLRSWLYSQALHAAVHRKVPRSCQATPPRGSGGYDHWHCGRQRNHPGRHRYGSYEWGPTEEQVKYAPIEQRS